MTVSPRSLRRTLANARVSLATPEDAPGIVALARRCFSDTLRSDVVYDAAVIAQRIRDGEMASFVVRGEEVGEILLHLALEFYEARTPEVDLTFADPAWRMPKMLDRALQAAHAYANAGGAFGVSHDCVTSHVLIQQVCDRQACQPCALSLGSVPAGWKIQVPGVMHEHRVATIFHYKPFVFDEARIHLPARHAKMAREIYSWIGLPRTIVCDVLPPPAGLRSDVRYELYRQETDNSYICVYALGASALEEVREMLKRTRSDGLDSAFLYLPLASPHTPWLAEEASKMGFGFAGVLPHIDNGNDALIMQRPLHEVEYDVIRVYGERRIRLCEYVRSTMPAS